jgi:two-component system sensor histidine kinase UhpB
MLAEPGAWLETGARKREKERSMPLRVRLIVLVGLVLLISLAGGSVLVAWRAAHSVRTELRAALDVGTKTIRNGYDDIAGADDRAKEMRRLVATFNGNRHVRATLLDAAGNTEARSELFPPTRPVPGWFTRLIMSRPPAIRLPVPTGADGGSVIVLQADPTDETGEVWDQSRDAVSVLAGFAALSALLIAIVVGHALRSLTHLGAAIDEVGNGEYGRPLPVQGPPELKRLANGFNGMTQRLATVAAQNDRLNGQLLTLQAEERADLARDLHDEIGPLLFAVDMTAATIERLSGSEREAEIPAHVGAIHDAVVRMQRHVRVLLERLRPMQTIRLETAIERLVAFWRGRRPDIVFSVAVSLDDDCVGSNLKETAYRVVQEGVSNAIRHGKPGLVTITIEQDADGVRVEVADDGIGMSADSISANGSSRLGLIGMRERVMAMAGSLSFVPGREGRGISLVVRLPNEDALEPQQASVPG